jgi:hypothetical protein
MSDSEIELECHVNKFDGKVGDYVEDWLEQLEFDFARCEKSGGLIDARTKIDTAILNTSSDVGLVSSKHEKNYGEFPTWESFAKFMRETYGSHESGYSPWCRLRNTKQGDNESVHAYYWRFYRILSRQARPMMCPRDNFIYNFMFVDGLKDVVFPVFMRLVGSREMVDDSLQDILDLAKRAESIVRMGVIASNPSQAGRFRNRRPGRSSGSGPGNDRGKRSSGKKSHKRQHCAQ